MGRAQEDGVDLSRILTIVFLTNVLAASVRLATPLVIASLGEAFAERSGVFNLGVEGVMLLCGLTGFAAAYATGSLWLGVAAAALAGAALGLVFGFFTITLKADQTASGFALYVMSTGAALYANRLLFPGIRSVPQIQPFLPIPIPGLSGIPVLGKVLFTHPPLTYIMFLLVILSALTLFRTPFGLRVSAIGENPRAADTVGLDVNGVRFICVVIGSTAAGVAGAFFSLSDLGLYVDSMIGGRGFISLALVVFGQWNPLLILAGGLLFGAVDAVQSRLQIMGAHVAPQFLIMTPYLLTVLALLLGRGRRAPSSLAVPYRRE